MKQIGDPSVHGVGAAAVVATIDKNRINVATKQDDILPGISLSRKLF